MLLLWRNVQLGGSFQLWVQSAQQLLLCRCALRQLIFQQQQHTLQVPLLLLLLLLLPPPPPPPLLPLLLRR